MSSIPPLSSFTDLAWMALLNINSQAVRAAIDRKVHIISMSWTIEKTKENARDILDLEAAIEAAAKAGILMFCAANDQGVASRDKSFPVSTEYFFFCPFWTLNASKSLRH
jgi:hypothetical protein